METWNVDMNLHRHCRLVHLRNTGSSPPGRSLQRVCVSQCSCVACECMCIRGVWGVCSWKALDAISQTLMIRSRRLHLYTLRSCRQSVDESMSRELKVMTRHSPSVLECQRNVCMYLFMYVHMYVCMHQDRRCPCMRCAPCAL